MPANRKARTRGDRHDREQPRAVRQLQVESRGAKIEAALADAESGGGHAQQVDELGVGVCDRLDALAPTIGVTNPHVVAAVGVDVLEHRVVEEALQALQPEQRVEHGLRDFVLFVDGQGRATRGKRRAGVAIEGVRDELTPQRLVLRRCSR